MTDIEHPESFYLGREYDLERKKVLAGPVLYNSRDLTTHGVVVGMTGSGKTGLCISLLEEAAIDGIPSVILDVKGDLTNLLLQFPDLDPKDFARWLNPEDARIHGKTTEEYAAQLTERWRDGLRESLQGPDRIRRLKEASEYVIYTPGSDAGLPLSILKNFNAPGGRIPRELLNQKIDATASALLGLTGIVSDPVQSREHILIAQILLHAWGRDEDLDLKTLIRRIQNPPIREVGAFEIDVFYPEPERLRLALALNNILASPSFSTWIEGAPLDLGQMMFSPGGKPRQVLFYLAHLDDSQRMFFLTLLLEEVLNWTRKQPGSSTLRALLYFDEVFGYLPPHPANPPTKLPLMTLMKQARAFGLGVLLATQNPVDLDYKALSNAGTWIIGKLQTERDKARLLEGLEGVAAERGTLTDRAYLENVISALGSRVFLLHDVHRPKPVLFQTRWALSFLRGPMSRDQVEELMRPVREQRAAGGGAAGEGVPEPPPLARAEDQTFRDQLRRTNVTLPRYQTVPPELPASVVPVYLPLRAGHGPASPAQPAPGGGPPPAAHEYPVRRVVLYRPFLMGHAEVTFHDRKRDLTFRRPYRLLAEPPENNAPVAWRQDEALTGALAPGPVPGSEWAGVPNGWDSPRRLASLRKDLADHLYHSAKLALFENEKLALVSEPGEDAQTFLKRCEAAAVRQADAESEKALASHKGDVEKLRQTLPPTSFADMLVVVRWFRSPTKEDQQRQRIQKQISDKEQEWVRKRAAIYAKWTQTAEQYRELLLKPRRDDVSVTHHGLAWVPFWHCTYADGRTELIAAY